jgi:hypothetical protein
MDVAGNLLGAGVEMLEASWTLDSIDQHAISDASAIA